MKRKLVAFLLSLCTVCTVGMFSACEEGNPTLGENGGEQTGEGNGEQTGGENTTPETFSVGLAYTLIDENTAYEISGMGECKDRDIVIPATYEGLPVTSIGQDAFENCAGLNSIVIPDSITTIASSAFTSCTGLMTITIPSSVTTIASTAFFNCYRLIEVINQSSVADSDIGASHAKQILKEAPETSNFIEKDDYIFYNDNGSYYLMAYTGTETDLVLPDTFNGSAYEVYNAVFILSDSLTSIQIPEGVTAVGHFTFMMCNNLTSIVLPKSITTIGMGLFWGCAGVDDIYYRGTATDWSNIDMGIFNEFNDFLRFYSEKEPALNTEGTAYDGNYWYYGENGVPTKW